MIAIRQIHEHLANVIEVPTELRNKKAEVIFLAMDGIPQDSANAEMRSSASDESNPSAVEFFGSLPDFPERVAQGEFDSRQELV
jgi:hypothetical protein